MTLDPIFLTLMPDTVTVYAQQTLDQYGKRTWSGSGTSYRCRISDVSDLIRDADGRDVVVNGKVYLYGAPALTTNHRLVLPDGTSPVIIAVQVQRDETGAHHTVLLYGK